MEIPQGGLGSISRAGIGQLGAEARARAAILASAGKRLVYWTGHCPGADPIAVKPTSPPPACGAVGRRCGEQNRRRMHKQPDLCTAGAAV